MKLEDKEKMTFRSVKAKTVTENIKMFQQLSQGS